MNLNPPVPGHPGRMHVVSERACVVYDTTSGEIVHRFRSLTFESGSEPPAEQIAQSALSQAKHKLQDNQTLDVLHVNPDDPQFRHAHRVDHKKRALVSHN